MSTHRKTYGMVVAKKLQVQGFPDPLLGSTTSLRTAAIA
jgi:hypothetical protein